MDFKIYCMPDEPSNCNNLGNNLEIIEGPPDPPDPPGSNAETIENAVYIQTKDYELTNTILIFNNVIKEPDNFITQHINHYMYRGENPCYVSIRFNFIVASLNALPFHVVLLQIFNNSRLIRTKEYGRDFNSSISDEIIIKMNPEDTIVLKLNESALNTIKILAGSFMRITKIVNIED